VLVTQEREKIIWNFDNVQKAYGTRGYEAKKLVSSNIRIQRPRKKQSHKVALQR
jgi:hypothetical protein